MEIIINKNRLLANTIYRNIVTHRLRLPPATRPFLRAKIIKSYVYLSVILWYPTLQVSFVLFTVMNSGFIVGYSIPQTFTVYQTLQYLCWPCFGKFLGFLGLNSILCWLGGQFQIGQDCFN